MKWIDILSAAMNNLLRRKLRSILTMLGVVIGTAAIVVTMSLGYGAEKAQMTQLEKTTNLRLIQVFPSYGFSLTASEGGTGKRITKITDAVVNRIRRVANVDAVTPMVQLWGGSPEFIIQTGKYESSVSLLAVSPQDFGKIFKLKNGRIPSSSTSRMEFMLAEPMMAQFRDPKKTTEAVDVWSLLYEGKELPLPNINWLNAQYDLRMQWEDYENTDENNPDPLIRTKEYKAKMVGTVETSFTDSDFWALSSCAVVNLRWLRKLQRDNRALFKELSLPDFSTFDSVYVLAKSVDNVEQAVKDLTDMGIQCYSPQQFLNTYKEQIQTVQGFLGFIGAISMLVAALSIANTMMMSIYERTREIGVMKVLGCRIGNIRAMFLSEAAYIGIFGGGMGLLLSYGLSYAINNVEWLQQMVGSIMSSAAMFSTDGAQTSIIPSSLALSTWGGVVLVSLISGIYPAQRAMSLSSLAAIRNAD